MITAMTTTTDGTQYPCSDSVPIMCAICICCCCCCFVFHLTCIHRRDITELLTGRKTPTYLLTYLSPSNRATPTTPSSSSCLTTGGLSTEGPLTTLCAARRPPCGRGAPGPTPSSPRLSSRSARGTPTRVRV